MRTITLPWVTWRTVIAVLGEKALPHMLEHTDHLERQLEHYGPDQATVTLILTDDVFSCSYYWARWQLGILLPVEGASTVEHEAGARG
jgi:hypothetical protein